MPVRSSGQEPPFSIWIARLPEPDGPYVVRFEASNGKGILRVSRPGSMMEPPARSQGAEPKLTAMQLINSRFTHLWGRGAFRQSYLFTQIAESELEGLVSGQWVELKGEIDVGIHYLVLPEPDQVDDMVVAMDDAEDELSDPSMVAEVFSTTEEEEVEEPVDIASLEMFPDEPTPRPQFKPVGTLRPSTLTGDQDLRYQLDFLRSKLEDANRRNLDLERKVAELERTIQDLRHRMTADEAVTPRSNSVVTSAPRSNSVVTAAPRSNSVVTANPRGPGRPEPTNDPTLEVTGSGPALPGGRGK